MLIDLDGDELEILINGINWILHETNCPDNHKQEYQLRKKLKYFLEEWTEIEK